MNGRGIAAWLRAATAACLVGAVLVLTPAPAGAANATYVVNLTTDVADTNLGDGICDTSATAGSQCTLRAAIQTANADGTTDTITFNLAGTGVRTISPTSPLPTITAPVVIDGYTQPGASENTLDVGNNAVPLVQLSGTTAGAGTNGLTVSASNVRIRGLVINRFAGRGVLTSGYFTIIQGCFIGVDATGAIDVGNGLAGIEVAGPDGRVGGDFNGDRNVISGNGASGVLVSGPGAEGTYVINSYIGVNAAGTADVGNSVNGVHVANAPKVLVGLQFARYRNVISGNDAAGLRVDGAHDGGQVLGNRIGTNAAGTAAIPNFGRGIDVAGSGGIRVGGISADGRNVVSGNGLVGIAIAGGTNDIIAGNLVGTDVTGTTAVPNGDGGIRLTATVGTMIGGSSTLERNVIAGNTQSGIYATSAGDQTTGLRIVGNHIGTNARGTARLANTADGIVLAGATGAQIGGTSAAERNVISGNASAGIETSHNSTGNRVLGNFIGTNAAGTGSIPNTYGLYLNSPLTTVGGTEPGAGNVVSGNSYGVYVHGGGDGAVIRGNLIGTDATGTVDLGNALEGVAVNAPLVVVGGGDAGAGNVIAGNNRHGITVYGSDAWGATIQGNRIGTDVNGAPRQNNGAGIRVAGVGGGGPVIGGDVLAGNTIAYNASEGVEIADGTGTTVTYNSIHSNAGIGIDLGPDGRNSNDFQDVDTGANNLQNSPSITDVTFGSGVTAVSGTFVSTPSTTFQIDLYASPDTEGATYLGTTSVTTDAAGETTFSVQGRPTAGGQRVVVTATDPSGNTSEFSLSVLTPAAPVVTVTNPTVTETDGQSNLTFTVQLSAPSAYDVTVDYATAGDTARSGVDFAARTGTVTFGSGTTSKPVLVPVTGDLLDEDDETMLLRLSNATFATILDSEGLGTIVDNDAEPTITVTDVAVDELDTATYASFTVSLSGPSGKSIEVDYTTGDGTAVAGTDYTARSGTLLFKPGATSRRVSVSVAGDNATEAAETFQLLLSDALEATIADATGVATIADDDTEAPPPVTVSVNDASIVESDASLVYVTFTIRLSQASASPVSVDIATADITAIANVDYRARTLTVSIPAGTTSVTRQIAVNPDTIVEGTETFALNLSNPVGATIADAQGIGTIIDDADG